MGQRGDVGDRVFITHIERIIAPHHHPPGTDGLDEIIKRRHGVDKGIETEKPKIIARRPVDIRPSLGADLPTVIPAAANERAGAPAMSEIELETRKLFEYAAEDQTRRSHCGVAGVAD